MKKTTLLITAVLALAWFAAGCGAGQTMADQKMRVAVEWRKQGDMGMYVKTVNEAYKADPNNPFALNGMGTVAEAEGNYEEAEGFYKKAMENAGSLRVLASEEKGDQGVLLKDVVAQNLKSLKAKMK